jgi:hypothetical protein
MRWIPLRVFTVLVVMAAPALAQSPQTAAPVHPDGWWGGFGGGISALRFACADCGDDQPVYEAPAVAVAFGKSIGRKVAFGVEYGGAFPTLDSGARMVASSLTGMARWYPADFPIFLKFGIGLSRVRATVTSNGETVSDIRNGTGIVFGAGWDFRVGRSVALTPYVGWYMSAIGDIGDPNSTTQRRDVSWNTWSFGVGITIF